jgi:antitoxin YefM
VVTRQKAEAVVMVSLSDWNAMEETLHLLSTTTNAERLRASVRQLEAGRGVERRLPEE